MLRRRPQTEWRAVRCAAPILAAFVLAAANHAGAQPSEPDAVESSAVLGRFLDEVRTLEAEFEQEVWTADRLVDVQSGSLALERPSRFRWHYREPFEQLVVADGKNLWIHDVELESASVTPLDDSVASSPAMLLSGDDAVREGFTVAEEYESDGLSWVRLEPEIEGTDFRSVLLGFDGLKPLRLELVDGLGQRTLIALSDVDVNVDLDEDLFEFDPPRGVDVIGTPAR